jgi:hypothetical protein
MARKHITTWIRQDHGQSIVVVVISMTLIIAVAAFAVDVGLWLEKHHQAQVTADAAALAAANYMSNGGTAGSAVGYAETYASDNNLPITDSNVVVDTANKTVAVTVPTTGPRVFAGIALGSGPSISARAVASWRLQDCSVAGSNCAFIYAGDNVCSGNTGVTDTLNGGTINHGITIAKSGTGNSQAITGDVISASSITTDVNGNPHFGVAVYSDATGCGSYSTRGNAPTPNSPNPYSNMYPRAVTSLFPIDYRLIYAACGATSTKFGVVQCDPNTHYPTYCTQVGVSTVSVVTTNAIYCNAGSSGTPGDPSTWNGTINVSSGGNATFIAGTVDISIGNSTLGPAAGNQLLAYGAECNASTTPPATCPTTGATTTTSPAIALTYGGNGTVTGDLFAPAGVIDTGGAGTPSITGFLEGWDIVYNARGTATGEGPPVTNDANFTGDYLIQ